MPAAELNHALADLRRLMVRRDRDQATLERVEYWVNQLEPVS